ncbi:hypothetical protein GGR11_002585 [Brevundimonas mediterranea]|uniref:Uncharacterized protein n=1 Tax=Brevundimonas mediterranea TaxID=74329 RepID=A0A7W6A6F9_9CAUL|nr:hypothetical protein [Brevundimonas mediterranea]MBB3873032.1 hypothetical protein [Brevundimonas mediterranea]
MDPIGEHALGDQAAGQGVEARGPWLVLVKSCVEAAHLPGRRQYLLRGRHTLQSGLLMQRRQGGERPQIREGRRGQLGRALEGGPAMHDAMCDDPD